MPKIIVDDIQMHYEIYGEGRPLVFIHGAWMSQKMWKMQIEYFSKRFKVIVYDVRGHGETGNSQKNKYSIELFAEDLRKFLEILKINKPVICGISMGGMIAQGFAARHSEHLSALILVDTAISTELTLNDKLIKYILAPKWMFLILVRMLGVKKYADFAFWFSEITRTKEWIGEDKEIQKYIKEEMLEFDVKEFNKIFAALYDFKLQDLSNIKVPTLIVNGEYETKSVHKHAKKMEEMIVNSSKVIISQVGHVPNLEKPEIFNRTVMDFLAEN